MAGLNTDMLGYIYINNISWFDAYMITDTLIDWSSDILCLAHTMDIDWQTDNWYMVYSSILFTTLFTYKHRVFKEYNADLVS